MWETVYWIRLCDSGWAEDAQWMVAISSIMTFLELKCPPFKGRSWKPGRCVMCLSKIISGLISRNWFFFSVANMTMVTLVWTAVRLNYCHDTISLKSSYSGAIVKIILLGIFHPVRNTTFPNLCCTHTAILTRVRTDSRKRGGWESFLNILYVSKHYRYVFSSLFWSMAC